MVKSILLVSAILAAVSMAAPAGPDSAVESVAVHSGDSSKIRSIEKRSFAASCRNCKMGFGAPTAFNCDCTRINGQTYSPTLLLNECLGNADGWLTWQRNGNFGGSCRDPRYDAGTTRLHIVCKTISGNWIPSSVVLDERLHNDNGILWCSV